MGVPASVIAPDSDWAPIPGFPSYQVTRDGRVRRARGCRGHSAGSVLSPRGPHQGYFTYQLCEGAGKKTEVKRAHCVALAYVGPRPDGALIRHLDGQRHRDVLGNLEWGTRKENAEDMVAHGTSPRGERNGQSKLTLDDVLLIREIHRASAPTHKALSLLFDVERRAIGKIVNGERWAWA